MRHSAVCAQFPPEIPCEPHHLIRPNGENPTRTNSFRWPLEWIDYIYWLGRALFVVFSPAVCFSGGEFAYNMRMVAGSLSARKKKKKKETVQFVRDT